jgi:glycosyltransferase involved in cell wall biosynthesis
MEYLYLSSALLCVYSYFLYPLILKLIPRRKTAVAHDACSAGLPRLSLIITARNEQDRISEKVEDSLRIDYPRDIFEIIVASDCSTDDTDDIVRTYTGNGVLLVRADERRGKEYAQLCAIREASGDILVFSDVATRIPENALRLMAREFADERVGALSSEDRFVSKNGEIAGEGAYVRYEMWLRRLESERAGLVGLSGSLFAARREVCKEWDIYSPSDFNTALNCVKKGLVAIHCSDVIGIYQDVKDTKLEYSRKLRTVIRGLTAIVRHPEVLSPLRTGLFAFQVWSHKIMRWGVPWFLLLFAVLTLLLLGQGMIYRVAFAIQLAFYATALAGWLFPGVRGNTLARIVFFFVQTNLAMAQAELSFLLGKRMTVWTPSQR